MGIVINIHDSEIKNARFLRRSKERLYIVYDWCIHNPTKTIWLISTFVALTAGLAQIILRKQNGERLTDILLDMKLVKTR